MTIGEAIQEVQTQYSRGVQSDDSRLSPRYIFSVLTSVRSRLLRQQYNKNQIISQWSYQTLPCVELVVAPVHECACIPNGRCLVLRTKYQIPELLSGLDSMMIKSVTSLDGNLRFDFENFENVKYAIGNKYTSKKPSYYIRNRFMYVTVLKSLKALTITGIFHDPVVAYLFKSLCPCEDCECMNITDMNFPIEPDLLDSLARLSSERLILLFKQMNQDKLNNSSDDTDIQGGMVHQPQQQPQ